MYSILFIVLIIFILYIIIGLKIKFDFKSLLKKGVKYKENIYNFYTYTGKQGSGKTLASVAFLHSAKGLPIYTNLKSLTLEHYTINNFNDLLNLQYDSKCHDCIIFYDEIFTILSKSDRMQKDFLQFISQMRKRHIIFITTCQEWLELNMTLRRYTKTMVECSTFSILGKLYQIRRFYDSTQMKWSQEDNEYIAPLIETRVCKVSSKIANSYDTLEIIG